MESESDNKIISVPQTMFAEFLKTLEEQKIPKEIIERLKKTLVENGQISVDALKNAMFLGNTKYD